jgi:flavin-binding protein dodecin
MAKKDNKAGKGAKASRNKNAVYRVIDLVGTSSVSWADAARNAVETASHSLRDLRVAEVDKLDVKIEGGEIVYRAKLKLSFKYHGEDNE